MRCSENLSFRQFPMDQVRIVRRCARPARSCRRPVASPRDSKRVTPQGEPISVEFLIDEPSFQPHHMPFIKNLGTLGIEATLRVVDLYNIANGSMILTSTSRFNYFVGAS